MCLLLATTAIAAGPGPDNAPELQQMLDQTRRDLQRLNTHTQLATEHIASLRARLAVAEQRNQQQAEQLAAFDEQLKQVRAQGSAAHGQWQQSLFRQLATQLPTSPVARVETTQLVIPTDPVFVFGTGELGQEGRDRLQPVVQALLATLDELPPELPWRLEVAGHTDRRPLRNDARFAGNWELSAARAVAVLRFLHEQGIASPRLAAVGYGASEPLDQAINKAAHRRNRRVEIRLRFPDPEVGIN